MTSPTTDHDGIEPIISAISDAEWKQFAHNMEIVDPKTMQDLAQSCNPKLLRRLFSSDMATQSLHEAAKLGKIDILKVLLRLGSTDVNKIDNARRTPLHYAAQEGHLDIASTLLKEKNIDASLCDGYGNTALHNAAQHGDVDVFDMLLKAQQVDVNSTNCFGETALILAAKGGNKEIVDLLLEVPNVVVIPEDHETTPLHAAAMNGHAVIVEKILARMDVNSTNYKWQQSPLHLATVGVHENVVDLLLKAPTIKPFLKDHGGNTPLHIAAVVGHEAIFEKLLQMPEVDVNGANKKQMMALHCAARKKHANIVTKLLAVPSVDLDAKTKYGATPLHMAAMAGGVDVVQVLLATGKVDVNITDSKKHTAIHWATMRGHLNVVELLLGVPTVAPFLGDHNDNTPLHLAAKLGHQGIVERLLAVPHLDVNKVNTKNETPLFLAARHGCIDVVDLLLESPEVDVSICDHHGDCPFHAAVEGGHANIAEKLITPPRAVPIHSNKESLTALHLCIKGGHENLVDILLKQSTVDASAKDVRGNFPIHYAALNGNTCILRKILSAPGVDVNSINDRQDTALHVAMRAGHIHVADLLLQLPNLNAIMQDRDGNSALHVAATYGEEEIVQRLLQVVGVDVNAKGKGGATALVLAAQEGQVRIVDLLLEVPDVLNNGGVSVVKEGPDEPSTNDLGVEPLLAAAFNGHDTVIKSLLKHGVDVNGLGRGFGGPARGPALCEAIEYGHPKVVEVLLSDPNIDPNRRNWFEIHPLFLAARDGQEATVKKLMATKKIDMNELSKGKTALHGAARKGREQVVKILLSTPDTDVHIKNKKGETALFYAARADNKTIMKDIYNASKVNVGREWRTDQIQLNIDDKNDEGESIIHLAARKFFHNVIDFLMEVKHHDPKSMHVNLKTSPPKGKEDGFIHQSAVEKASDANHFAMVEKLTKFNGISFTKEKDGKKTVLQRIFDNKQWETFNILRRTPEVTDYIDALYKDRQANVDAANAILVGAALIASVTFASWLQPPLGYATYYHEQFSDSLPAPPVAYPEYAAFDHHPSLQAFWVFNSLSFFSAIAIVISGARSVLPVEKLFIEREVENLRRNLLKTSILLGFSMFFVLLAFATAGVIVLPPVMKFRSNIFSTIAIGGSVCFVFLFLFGKSIYKLLFDIKNSQAARKIGFFERRGFKPWHMPNPFIRS